MRNYGLAWVQLDSNLKFFHSLRISNAMSVRSAEFSALSAEFLAD
jgi:hypothetical protein